MKNPYDNTHKHSFDLPPVGLDPAEEQEELVGGDQREEALRQKASAALLTESKAFGILAKYVEDQKTARVNHLLLTPITDANRDELNFMRGELAGLMLALKFAEQVAQGAEATLEVLNEARKEQ